MVAGQNNLLGMNERHFRRSQQKMANLVSRERAGRRRDNPYGHAQIRAPRLPAEFPPLDLQRLLPPQILRLFVRQNFLRIGVRVHGL